jgi:hypothetical protein
MALGIQHVQAAQLFELPSFSTRGVPDLRNEKWLNSNLTCGTNITGRSDGDQPIIKAFVNKNRRYIRSY